MLVREGEHISFFDASFIYFTYATLIFYKALSNYA